MTIDRPMVGDPVRYRDHLITVTHLGPDLLAHVDGAEIGNFYMTRAAAVDAAKGHIDLLEKEKEKKK